MFYINKKMIFDVVCSHEPRYSALLQQTCCAMRQAVAVSGDAGYVMGAWESVESSEAINEPLEYQTSSMFSAQHRKTARS